MAFCTSCGAQMEETARFCTSCGALAGQTGPAPEPEPESGRLPSSEEHNRNDEVIPEPQPLTAAETMDDAEDDVEPPFSPDPSFQDRASAVKSPLQEGFREPASFKQSPPEPRMAPQNGYAATISMAGFFWTLFLFCIPVVGHVVAGIWALGASRNPNRRNLSKAYLLLSLITLVVAAAAYLLLKLFPNELLGWLPQDVQYYLRSLLFLW
ncbi:MAG: zinc-ribbon domain-containing protein [Christensenellales bacterium]|jgi:hypothetical protein